MSHLSRLRDKFQTKAKKAAKKATKLIQNYSALSGGKVNEHDRIVFDLKGYIVKPAVLNEDEVNVLKELVLRQKNEPESLPPQERCLPGGAFAKLIDHPAVMNVLLDVIDPDIEKIRLEDVFLSYREMGEGEWKPHAGGPTTNPNYAYNFQDGRIYAGMTRVVWELTEVLQDQGGTCFIPGSHKANYNIRTNPVASIDTRNSGLWESYSCPPGSLIIFSEAVRHSADFWQNPHNPRIAIFCAYNHINVRHHKPSISPEVLERLAPRHQRFFKDVYHPQFDRV
ncbi:phytanoyl-CoA dioxygenase family protein [Pleurocapsa sp. PCC 7319]|uniref:phytanoyl-CoA dioxygenase family protein n=1 Tax=Pleurocapsa sp. PCC 7319 TaxID=118161 RepID=UPI00034BD655|nr:phytanoyl-CoA dioxygenase family protein [Pleurocapsa sp. PCC 7319]